MFSDIDLHVIIDFQEVNEDIDLVKDYFDAVKALWNYLHDIRIKSHEVEIYVQDENEPHISTGVYSLLNDEWIKQPDVPAHSKIFGGDKETIAKKANSLMDQIDRAITIMDEEKYDEAIARANKLSEKIKKFRKAGLE